LAEICPELTLWAKGDAALNADHLAPELGEKHTVGYNELPKNLFGFGKSKILKMG